MKINELHHSGYCVYMRVRVPDVRNIDYEKILINELTSRLLNPTDNFSLVCISSMLLSTCLSVVLPLSLKRTIRATRKLIAYKQKPYIFNWLQQHESIFYFPIDITRIDVVIINWVKEANKIEKAILYSCGSEEDAGLMLFVKTIVVRVWSRDLERIETSKMWIWRKTERLNRSDRVSKELALTENRRLLDIVLNRRGNWIEHVMREE